MMGMATSAMILRRVSASHLNVRRAKFEVKASKNAQAHLRIASGSRTRSL
jgi:hypothetical protein